MASGLVLVLSWVTISTTDHSPSTASVLSPQPSLPARAEQCAATVMDSVAVVADAEAEHGGGGSAETTPVINRQGLILTRIYGRSPELEAWTSAMQDLHLRLVAGADGEPTAAGWQTIREDVASSCQSYR